MGKLGKVVGWNLIALLVYTGLSVLITGKFSDGLLGSAIIAFIHATLCFVIAIGFFIAKKSDNGVQWLLAAGAVLLIGLSTCFGGLSQFSLH